MNDQEALFAKLDLSTLHLEKLQLCFSTQRKEENPIDSKQFVILSVSRLDLSSYGLTTEQINHLSDADMEAIAEELYHRYDLDGFGEDVVFIARLVLAEKEQYIVKLLTEELKKQLPPLYSQEKVQDPMVICKFFHPLSNMTWYAIEGSPVYADGFYDTDKEKVDFLFFGWVFSDFPEMGYFSLNEMWGGPTFIEYKNLEAHPLNCCS